MNGLSGRAGVSQCVGGGGPRDRHNQHTTDHNSWQQTGNMSSCQLREGDTKSRVSYEPHMFTVEINVAEYKPEVR